ncbi:hypothetical protein CAUPRSCDRAFT_11575 [Caulochytrium protostelioides]|uniref:Uncharacterized protein n=1 Tax=Caulochytrium protostelioides TaxID=1555241 RepID=A0A4P9WVP9_9FUNG|nr:hypothetical protein CAUPRSCDRAFT_11575 [Caulochytrium protostelioides]
MRFIACQPVIGPAELLAVLKARTLSRSPWVAASSPPEPSERSEAAPGDADPRGGPSPSRQADLHASSSQARATDGSPPGREHGSAHAVGCGTGWPLVLQRFSARSPVCRPLMVQALREELDALAFRVRAQPLDVLDRRPVPQLRREQDRGVGAHQQMVDAQRDGDCVGAVQRPELCQLKEQHRLEGTQHRVGRFRVASQVLADALEPRGEYKLDLREIAREPQLSLFAERVHQRDLGQEGMNQALAHRAQPCRRFGPAPQPRDNFFGDPAQLGAELIQEWALARAVAVARGGRGLCRAPGIRVLRDAEQLALALGNHPAKQPGHKVRERGFQLRAGRMQLLVQSVLLKRVADAVHVVDELPREIDHVDVQLLRRADGAQARERHRQPRLLRDGRLELPVRQPETLGHVLADREQHMRIKLDGFQLVQRDSVPLVDFIQHGREAARAGSIWERGLHRIGETPHDLVEVRGLEETKRFEQHLAVMGLELPLLHDRAELAQQPGVAGLERIQHLQSGLRQPPEILLDRLGQLRQILRQKRGHRVQTRRGHRGVGRRARPLAGMGRVLRLPVHVADHSKELAVRVFALGQNPVYELQPRDHVHEAARPLLHVVPELLDRDPLEHERVPEQLGGLVDRVVGDVVDDVEQIQVVQDMHGTQYVVLAEFLQAVAQAARRELHEPRLRLGHVGAAFVGDEIDPMQVRVGQPSLQIADERGGFDQLGLVARWDRGRRGRVLSRRRVRRRRPSSSQRCRRRVEARVLALLHKPLPLREHAVQLSEGLVGRLRRVQHALARRIPGLEPQRHLLLRGLELRHLRPDLEHGLVGRREVAHVGEQLGMVHRDLALDLPLELLDVVPELRQHRRALHAHQSILRLRQQRFRHSRAVEVGRQVRLVVAQLFPPP